MSEDEDHEPHEPVEGIFTDVGAASATKPKFLVKDFLPVGLVILVAPPKAGKSTLSLALAAIVAGHKCGALPDFLSEVVLGGRVVCFSYEADAGEIRHTLEVGLGTKVKPDGSFLVADDPWLFRLDDEDGATKLLGWLDELDPRLAILDPFRDFHSLDEKDSGDMIRILRPIRQWAIQHDACCLLVHHTKKREDGGQGGYDNNDIRGSSAIFGAADGIIVLSPRGENTEIRCTMKKGKSWNRTISIASYDKIGSKSIEKLTEMDGLVLKALHAGAPTLEVIAKQLHCAKSTVLDCIGRLERARRVEKVGKIWKLIDKRGAADI